MWLISRNQKKVWILHLISVLIVCCSYPNSWAEFPLWVDRYSLCLFRNDFSFTFYLSKQRSSILWHLQCLKWNLALQILYLSRVFTIEHCSWVCGEYGCESAALSCREEEKCCALLSWPQLQHRGWWNPLILGCIACLLGCSSHWLRENYLLFLKFSRVSFPASHLSVLWSYVISIT